MTVRSPKNPKPESGQSEKKPVAFLPPLKPRPLLFAVMWVIVLAWLGALIWMRVRTVKRPASEPTPVLRLQAQ
jgi:hypothetical protein